MPVVPPSTRTTSIRPLGRYPARVRTVGVYRPDAYRPPAPAPARSGWSTGLGGLLDWLRPKPRTVAVAPGVAFDATRTTADGAPVRVLALDPSQVAVEAAFIDGVKAMPPEGSTAGPRVLAAINGTFFGFGDNGTFGDMRGGVRTYRDEQLGGNYDDISDRRYHLALTADGEARFGQGGMSETDPADQLNGFMGGLGKLFDQNEAFTLDADLASGRFLARLKAGVADRSFPNVDLESSICRTVVGLAADGRLLMVTLGEGAKREQGAGLAEAAKILLGMGAVEAYVLDGGGSTHMRVPGVVATKTDGRQVKSYLVVKARTTTGA